MNKYLILDCFVDEPACFGVPPFISPYPRYIYGALVDAGVTEENIDYITIEDIRTNQFKIEKDYSIVFLVGGAVVPGKYLGYKIGTYNEIIKIFTENRPLRFAVGGLVSHQLINKQSDIKNVYNISADIEFFAYSTAKGTPEDNYRTVEQISRWSLQGADVVKKHPDYPVLIAEIETYRGCPRESHCSFCSEKIFKDIVYREQENILSEIDKLISLGISRFRIGRQADILAYKSSKISYKNGFSKPDPGAVSELFNELKLKKESGNIKLLNIDNANPGTIINYPCESETILSSIVDAITPGDTIPLGVESLDPEVIKLNNLKVDSDSLLKVISIINSIGGKRINNIPILLPGINLIHGLRGETKDTFKTNYETLLKIKENNLLIKRINIRKLSPFPGTKAFENYKSFSKAIVNRYEYYKEKIRQEIDHYMLTQIYPVGTILDDFRVEVQQFNYSYARQLASYAITAKIPYNVELKKITSIMIASHRERSIIGFTIPLKINDLNQKAIELIPGVGKKTALNIILNRPFNSLNSIKKIAPGIPESVLERIKL